MRKTLILLFIVLFAAAAVLSARKKTPEIPNIFVFVIFGLNADESNETLMPYIFGDFKNSSYYYSNMRFVNGLDFHMPVFKNLLTGYPELTYGDIREKFPARLMKTYGFNKDKTLIASHWENWPE